MVTHLVTNCEQCPFFIESMFSIGCTINKYMDRHDFNNCGGRIVEKCLLQFHEHSVRIKTEDDEPPKA